ncbi:hypothetical protein CCH79_00015675 [Gambusia affinis]|uniref:Uncharacterized protein n=1 Tax=Gambusia affinis TaxID=33528 RepID=A0A315W403_GAMAF|nr:hypothetical protein CCH79_00015675 [Gambusia affinis]
MEGVKLAAVLLLVVLVQTVSALGAPLSAEDEEGQMWTVDNWQGFPVEGGLTIRLADLIKRSKGQQFHGLMGRSPGALARLGRKRNNNNKGEMFVGLMGRRSLGEGNAASLCPDTSPDPQDTVMLTCSSEPRPAGFLQPGPVRIGQRVADLRCISTADRAVRTPVNEGGGRRKLLYVPLGGVHFKAVGSMVFPLPLFEHLKGLQCADNVHWIHCRLLADLCNRKGEIKGVWGGGVSSASRIHDPQWFKYCRPRSDRGRSGEPTFSSTLDNR